MGKRQGEKLSSRCVYVGVNGCVCVCECVCVHACLCVWACVYSHSACVPVGGRGGQKFTVTVGDESQDAALGWALIWCWCQCCGAEAEEAGAEEARLRLRLRLRRRGLEQRLLLPDASLRENPLPKQKTWITPHRSCLQMDREV